MGYDIIPGSEWCHIIDTSDSSINLVFQCQIDHGPDATTADDDESNDWLFGARARELQDELHLLVLSEAENLGIGVGQKPVMVISR
eukprot:NODE_5458_length_384_cov_293.755224_g4381_i0.p4 GENE.NODE_5458_length_384_cov_293.755224_g4381_i0~~NODE_5458_length_384_cov_293.755224_g4381_i0.p4  ORF type:complete len:86 (-),score=21.71 NODE_5458_length_384_cov_293.755224_g4381_i0:97-354(-)